MLVAIALLLVVADIAINIWDYRRKNGLTRQQTHRKIHAV